MSSEPETPLWSYFVAAILVLGMIGAAAWFFLAAPADAPPVAAPHPAPAISSTPIDTPLKSAVPDEPKEPEPVREPEKPLPRNGDSPRP
jgi:hypothetical protein